MVEREISIDGRRIGSLHPPYVVCEISANHNGSLERAIKIQTYTADSLTIDCDRPEFQIKGGLWDGYSLHRLYLEASTPYEWLPALFQCARELGVTIFSTPFDEAAVELLARLSAPAYKIASFEAIDLPLVACVARQGKPMIISTGMASLGEIQEAVATSRGNGAGGIALLHCVSSYPAPVEDLNLRTVPHLAEAFGVVSGLSDHTPGVVAAVASVALGGSVVEKHFTLSRADGGLDAAFSLEPHEFKQLVANCRDAWKALGRVHYDLEGSEKESLVFRRSLYVVADVAAGEKLTLRNIRSIRPGNGLAPKHIGNVIGKRAARDLVRGHPLGWTDLESRE